MPGELGGCQVTQRRVDPLLVVNFVEDPRQLSAGVGEIPVVAQRHLFLLDRSHQSLGIPVLLRAPNLGHADPHPLGDESPNVHLAGVLHSLIRVMDLGYPSSQRPVQCRQRQAGFERSTQLSAPDHQTVNTSITTALAGGEPSVAIFRPSPGQSAKGLLKLPGIGPASCFVVHDCSGARRSPGRSGFVKTPLTVPSRSPAAGVR